MPSKLSLTTLSSRPVGRGSDRHHGAAAARVAAAGRLSVDELEARIDRTYAAATRADLRELTNDLPAAPTRRPRRKESEWRAWASVSVLLLVIWAATGAGVFWPVWPIGFWALGLVLGAPHHRWERRRV